MQHASEEENYKDMHIEKLWQWKKGICNKLTTHVLIINWWKAQVNSFNQCKYIKRGICMFDQNIWAIIHFKLSTYHQVTYEGCQTFINMMARKASGLIIFNGPDEGAARGNACRWFIYRDYGDGLDVVEGNNKAGERGPHLGVVGLQVFNSA